MNADGPIDAQCAAHVQLTDVLSALHIQGISAEPGLNGAQYGLRIQRLPCGSTSKEVYFQVLAYIDRPISTRAGGHMDYTFAAAALRKLGFNGGVSLPEAPGEIRFGSGLATLSQANPVATLPPGILAWMSGTSAVSLAYLARSGVRPMQGVLDIGGKNMVGAKHVDTQGLSTNVLQPPQNKSTIRLATGFSANAGQIDVKGKLSANNLDAGSATVTAKRVDTPLIELRGSSITNLTANHPLTISSGLVTQAHEFKIDRDMVTQNFLARTGAHATSTIAAMRHLKSEGGTLRLEKSKQVGDKCERRTVAIADNGDMLVCKEVNNVEIAKGKKLDGLVWVPISGFVVKSHDQHYTFSGGGFLTYSFEYKSIPGEHDWCGITSYKADDLKTKAKQEYKGGKLPRGIFARHSSSVRPIKVESNPNNKKEWTLIGYYASGWVRCYTHI